MWVKDGFGSLYSIEPNKDIFIRISNKYEQPSKNFLGQDVEGFWCIFVEYKTVGVDSWKNMHYINFGSEDEMKVQYQRIENEFINNFGSGK